MVVGDAQRRLGLRLARWPLRPLDRPAGRVAGGAGREDPVVAGPVGDAGVVGEADLDAMLQRELKSGADAFPDPPLINLSCKFEKKLPALSIVFARAFICANPDRGRKSVSKPGTIPSRIMWSAPWTGRWRRCGRTSAPKNWTG